MFNYVFQGPPDSTIASPGSQQAPADGVDVVNSVEYISSGSGWKPSVPATVANKNLTAQVAAIAATTIYAVPAHMGGLYRLSYAAKITTAATTSSTLGGAGGYQAVYTDGDDSVVTTPTAQSQPAQTGNTTQVQQSGALIVNAKGGTNIQHSFGYTSVGGTAMAYALHVRIDYLG